MLSTPLVGIVDAIRADQNQAYWSALCQVLYQVLCVINSFYSYNNFVV